MGNCAAAYERWKELRADKKRVRVDGVLARMLESITEQGNRFQAKEKEYEAKIRGVQLQIGRVKVAAKGTLSADTRTLLTKLIGRRKLFEKERDRYSNMQLQNEAARTRIESMRTNAGLLKQHDQLVGGMKELADLGLHVKGVETKLDSAEDVMEDISEFNVAFAREPADPVLSDDDQQAINAELDAEFSTTGLHEVALTTPKFKARSGVEEPQQQEEDAEAQLAAMVMAEL